ncbi:MAG: hypothetical protein KC431_16500, partial [Myxococcales bacterium]|nr:hypothetical protein [Myxococcales bacterium]
RSAPPAPVRDDGGSGGGSSAPSDPLVIDQRTPDTDLTGTWGFSRGGASGPNYIASAEDDPFFAVNPVGYYQGVSVGGGNMPPFAPKEIGGQSAVLIWTGFERTDAGSRVFFQLSAAVEPEVVIEAGKVTVKLPRTSVTVRNNRRKLITKYFKTPVEEVLVSRKGKDVLAVLALRWEATPTWSVQPGNNGYQVLVFDFADNQDAPPPPPSSSDDPEPGPPPSPSDGAFLPTK